MKSARTITILSFAAVCCFVVFGCGKEDGGGSSQPTTDTPTTNTNVDTSKMDVEQLRAAALKCKTALEANAVESEKTAQDLIKTLSNDNVDERNRLREKMAGLNKDSEALYKQYEACIAQIKAKGGDVSDLEIE